VVLARAQREQGWRRAWAGAATHGRAGGGGHSAGAPVLQRAYLLVVERSVLGREVQQREQQLAAALVIDQVMRAGSEERGHEGLVDGWRRRACELRLQRVKEH
jgi:hypothetical protein